MRNIRAAAFYHARVADFRQLAARKDKECDGQPLGMPESVQVNRGRSATDVKGAWLR
ncbi:hypothetical protein O5623_00715 [Escherichia coli]|nr:hypothetical protein [Escherichia coli]